VSVVDYNSLKLEGELNVTRSAGGNQRAYYTVEAAKNGAGVWQVSASYTGDDVLYTTLPSWDVASNNLQVTMPLVTNFSSASLTYALNAPAVGASLPLAIDSSSLNIVDSAPLSYRNRIINGDMRISQRYDNVAAHTITAGQIFYTMDRFFVFATGANVTGQRIAGTGANPYVYRLTGAASNTQCLLIQRIEALNSEDLVNKTVTLQFEASAAVITSLDYDIRVPSARDNFGTTASVTSGTVTVSSTPTIFTVTFTLPANAANGVQINLGKSSGLVASQTFSISGVQLEVGSKASAFERRPYGMELGMAQRYYQKFVSPGGTRYAIGYEDGTTIIYPIQLSTPMRAVANTSASGNWQFQRNGSGFTSGTVVSTANDSSSSFRLLITVSSSLTGGNNVLIGNANATWTAEAEL
jgi:hypothetical protein